MYACKVIRKQMTRNEIRKELRTLEILCARRRKTGGAKERKENQREEDIKKNIVRVYTTWEEEQITGPARFIIMELATKTLEEHMDYLCFKYNFWEFCESFFRNDPETWLTHKSILNGLEYIHRHGCLHRDLKPSNGNLTLFSCNSTELTSDSPFVSAAGWRIRCENQRFRFWRCKDTVIDSLFRARGPQRSTVF